MFTLALQNHLVLQSLSNPLTRCQNSAQRDFESGSEVRSAGRNPMPEHSGPSAGVTPLEETQRFIHSKSLPQASHGETQCFISQAPMRSSEQGGTESDRFWQEVCQETKLGDKTSQMKIVSKPRGKASGKLLSSLRSRSRRGYRCEPRWNTSTRMSSSSWRPSSEVLWFQPQRVRPLARRSKLRAD